MTHSNESDNIHSNEYKRRGGNERSNFCFENELHKRAKIKAIENDMPLKDYVAELIREDLQKVADMPRPTLNNIISGKSVRPRIFGKVARTLGVDVTEILENEKE